MTTDIRSLVLQLRAWSEPIASGYEVPAAARTLHAAADALEAMAGEVARLRGEQRLKSLIGPSENAVERIIAERDRLKAALQVIASDPTHSGQAMIARKALGGDA